MSEYVHGSAESPESFGPTANATGYVKGSGVPVASARDLVQGQAMVSLDGAVRIEIEQISGIIGWTAIWGKTLEAWSGGQIPLPPVKKEEMNDAGPTVLKKLKESSSFKPTFTITPSTEFSGSVAWYGFYVATDRKQALGYMASGDYPGQSALTTATLSSPLRVYHIYSPDVRGNTETIAKMLGVNTSSSMLDQIAARGEQACLRDADGEGADEIAIPWTVASSTVTLTLVDNHPSYDKRERLWHDGS